MQSALVIGANGAIGQALVQQLSDQYQAVYAVSRGLAKSAIAGVNHHALDTTDEAAVTKWCEARKNDKITFQTVVCCIGMLHDDSAQVFPEKRLEDLNAAQLTQYFQINAITPAMWLKHLPQLMKSDAPSYLVFISARVGSISDNHLGGWYGYRASKAALNMLIKTAQVELQRRAKNIVLVSYHPGTVDSALSKPFQANVPAGKLFTAAFTAQQLLSYLPQLSVQNGPHYIDWQGQNIGW